MEKEHGIHNNDESFECDQENESSQLFDLNSYFNENRMLKLREKLLNDEVYELCEDVIKDLISLND